MKLVLKGSVTFLFILSLLNGFLLAQTTTPTPQDTSKSVVVNINTAGQAELERLPGIGPSLAKKILEFRQKNGAFKSPADLTAVQGIGDKKFEQIKNMVTVK